MNESLAVYLFFLLPLVGVISILILPNKIKSKVNFLFVVFVSALTSFFAVRALMGDPVTMAIGTNQIFGDISFQIDSLSAWFILIINLTCINGAFYGIGYMQMYRQQTTNLSLHWVFFLLFQSSMLWVCMLQNGLAFLIVWELMSITSFLLVIFEHYKKTTLKAGVNYLVQMHIGVLFLAAAFIWVYLSEGSFEFSSIEKFFSHSYNLWLFVLFFVGFGIKAGFIPLHSWLPQAHPAAPSHVSGVMSSVIVKLGIYGIFRTVFFLQSDFLVIGQLVLIISLLTGLFGILNAAVHRDIKKMLAYCTIENIGIIGIGIGLGLMGMGIGNQLLILLAMTGALLHTFNHSLFKSLLFFSAGSVYQQTHTRDMEKMGGLIQQMPKTGILFLLGALAIGGLPPLNGFVSEFILYTGIIIGIKSTGMSYIALMVSALAGLAIIGGLSLLTFTKTFGTVFLGIPRTELPHQPHEVGVGMRLPQYVIVVLMFSVGLFPQFYFSLVGKIVMDFNPLLASNASVPNKLFNSISNIGVVSLIFLMMICIIYIIRTKIVSKNKVRLNSTWACGYLTMSPKMQYSGKSFSKSLGKLLNFVVIEQKKYKEIQGREVFPNPRKYSSHYSDLFVIRVFDGLINRILYSLNYFQFVQNGKIQMYILYGIFFILLVFFGTVFKII